MIFWVNAHDNIQVTNGFLSTACTSSQLNTFNSRDCLDPLLKCSPILETDVQTATSPKSGQQFDSIEHSLFRFFSKTLHWSNFSLFSSFFESSHGVNTEFFMHQFDSLGAQSWYSKHFDHALRSVLMQSHPILWPLPFKNGLGQRRTESFADSLHFKQPTSDDQFVQILC